MICLRCKNTDFALHSDAEVEQEFRGEKLNVVSPLMECKNCGWQGLAPGQMDELGRRTSDAYRKKHKLLTSDQIRALRISLGMSQREFAEFLRVGEASVKRWENWKVQDPSSDELIRVKCKMAKTALLSWVGSLSYESIYSSPNLSCIPWKSFVHKCTSSVPVWPSIQTFQWTALDEVAYGSWGDKTLCIEAVHSVKPRMKDALRDVPILDSSHQRSIGGPSPPGESNTGRFSFPMPSPNERASEKKTKLIECK